MKELIKAKEGENKKGKAHSVKSVKPGKVPEKKVK